MLVHLPLSAIFRHRRIDAASCFRLMAHCVHPLRPLGKDKLFFTLRNDLGYYHNVALSISLTLHGVAEEEILRLIYAALARVVEKHPILFAVPVSELDPESAAETSVEAPRKACFKRLPQIKLSEVVSVLVRDSSLPSSAKESKAETTFDEEHDLVLQQIHNDTFDRGKAQWRILVLRDTCAVASTDANVGLTLAFIYHHALADGISGLAFLKELIAALRELLPKKEYESVDIVFAKEGALLPPLQGWNRVALGATQQQQEQQQNSEHLHSTNLWLGNKPHNTLPLTSRFTSFTFSSRTTQTLLSIISEHKTSVTPFLQTVLAASIFCTVADDFDRLVGLCSYSLRSYLDNLPESAIGLFIGGSRTEYLRKQFHRSRNDAKCGGNLATGVDFWREVDRTKSSLVAAVNKAIKPTPISDPGLLGESEQKEMLSWLKGLIDNPRVASFDLNNIGKYEAIGFEDCSNNEEANRITLGRTVFSASQSAIGSALKVNVVTGPTNQMTIGFAWQNEVHDEQIVRSIIDRFRREIELLK